jgi:hypothetical protein
MWFCVKDGSGILLWSLRNKDTAGLTEFAGARKILEKLF